MLKKILALVLGVCLLMPLAGCGSRQGSGQAAGPSQSEAWPAKSDADSSDGFGDELESPDAGLVDGADNPDSGEVPAGMKRIGDDEYGYINVPEHWLPFSTIGVDTPMLQYSNMAGSVVTLSHFAPTDLELMIKSLGEQNMRDGATAEYSTAMVDGMPAQVLRSDYPHLNLVLYVYLFHNPYGLTHYIAIEGPPDVIEELNGMVDSFSFTP